jgi:hypothetical protein
MVKVKVKNDHCEIFWKAEHFKKQISDGKVQHFTTAPNLNPKYGRANYIEPKPT